jgi:hypothetical protein
MSQEKIQILDIRYHRNGPLDSFYAIQFYLKQGKSRKDRHLIIGTFGILESFEGIRTFDMHNARFLDQMDITVFYNGATVMEYLKEALKNHPGYLVAFPEFLNAA